MGSTQALLKLPQVLSSETHPTLKITFNGKHTDYLFPTKQWSSAQGPTVKHRAALPRDFRAAWELHSGRRQPRKRFEFKVPLLLHVYWFYSNVKRGKEKNETIINREPPGCCFTCGWKLIHVYANQAVCPKDKYLVNREEHSLLKKIYIGEESILKMLWSVDFFMCLCWGFVFLFKLSIPKVFGTFMVTCH